MLSADFFWLALLLAFGSGVVFSFCYKKYTEQHQSSVSSEYFKGLNFLLNEQPDKAIEAFIKVLEVDDQTVELHLALGGLFRRKGEIDRATRIHQNLIARPDLSVVDREQAVHALAQDYYAAGLFDRAESLYCELLSSTELNWQAIKGLLTIYQKQKDWRKAVEVIRSLPASQRQQYTSKMAHYWCEIAEVAVLEKQFENAKTALNEASRESDESTRATYLQGELHYQRKEYAAAIQQWKKLGDDVPFLFELLVVRLIDCHQQLGQDELLKQYLRAIKIIPQSSLGFGCWIKAIRTLFPEEEQKKLFYNLLTSNGINQVAADELHIDLKQDQISLSDLKMLANLLLTEAKNRNIEYTCGECGFTVSVPHWHCPSCGEWDSFVN